MKYKIFAISDVHGEYDCMINSLKEAGYDENNKKHKLIVLGDMFDRGEESKEVYLYLKRLSDEGKAIILRGNHEPFFSDYLEGASLSPFNWLHNGTDKTFDDFLERTAAFQSWCFIEQDIENPTVGDFVSWLKYAREEINNEHPELLSWLKSLPNYYETTNYIFTHGAIDTEVEDWHNPHCSRGSLTDWDALAFDDGSFFGKEIKNTDKKVVIGHFGTRHLREMYNINDGKEANDILTREDGKVIAIDATTILSHKVNVLVIEDVIKEGK